MQFFFLYGSTEGHNKSGQNTSDKNSFSAHKSFHSSSTNSLTAKADETERSQPVSSDLCAPGFASSSVSMPRKDRNCSLGLSILVPKVTLWKNVETGLLHHTLIP